MSLPYQHKRYLSYLVRLWIDHNQDQGIWRASLENPQTGERLAFNHIEQLFEYIQGQCSLNTRDDIHKEKRKGVNEM